MFFIIDLLADLPIIAVSLLITYYALKVFLPNPSKHGTLYGMAIAEFLEHIVLPLLFVIGLFIMPGIIMIILLVAGMAGLFGRIIGNAKTDNDWLRIMVIIMVIFFCFLIPNIVVLMWGFGIEGWATLAMLSIVSTVAYFAFGRKRCIIR